jgi:hypothetical protein
MVNIKKTTSLIKSDIDSKYGDNFRRVRKIAKGDYYLSCQSTSLCPSAWKTRGIFMKFDNWNFFENLSSKFRFHKNLIRITDTLHEDLPTLRIPQWILRIRNVSNKICTEPKTKGVFGNFFFLRKTCRLWNNVVEADTPHMRIQYCAWALHDGFYSYKHTLRIRSTYCFCKATIVTRTRLNVTFIRTLPVLLIMCWR